MNAVTRHLPVLLDAVLADLQPRPGGRYLDATLGGGGHALAILEASAPDGRLLGLDRDPAAIARAGQRLAGQGHRASLVRASFDQLPAVAAREGFSGFEGMLYDLGFSSDQIDDASRGLSFQADGPLDMRLDPELPESAADLVNRLDERALANIIFQYGEERASRRIARAIVAARPIHRTTELAELVAKAAGPPRGGRRSSGPRIHPATLTFQALRIAVNDELGQLDRALDQAMEHLEIGGRLCVISFHSLEDRLVKRFMQAAARDCICPPELPICACKGRPRLRLISRKPRIAGATELQSNPRARSARLRSAERVA